jgi:hypothetical protein
MVLGLGASTMSRLLDAFNDEGVYAKGAHLYYRAGDGPMVQLTGLHLSVFDSLAMVRWSAFCMTWIVVAWCMLVGVEAFHAPR